MFTKKGGLARLCSWTRVSAINGSSKLAIAELKPERKRFSGNLVAILKSRVSILDYSPRNLVFFFLYFVLRIGGNELPGIASVLCGLWMLSKG